MAYYTRPQGLKTNGKPKSLQVTDDGYLKIDMQDATVVAEFTPGSTVKLTDGTDTAAITSGGAVYFTPASNMTVIDAPSKSTVTVVNNATFSATVTGNDIALGNYRHAILSYKTGTATTSPTMSIALQIKDSNGNYITHTTLSTVSTATSGFEEFYYLSAQTARVVCTFGGSGNFATTTVELTLMN